MATSRLSETRLVAGDVGSGAAAKAAGRNMIRATPEACSTDAVRARAGRLTPALSPNGQGVRLAAPHVRRATTKGASRYEKLLRNRVKPFH